MIGAESLNRAVNLAWHYRTGHSAVCQLALRGADYDRQCSERTRDVWELPPRGTFKRVHRNKNDSATINNKAFLLVFIGPWPAFTTPKYLRAVGEGN